MAEDEPAPDDGDYQPDLYPDIDSDLLNLAPVPLAELVSVDRSVLDNAIRRLLDDLDRAAEAISSWSSFADR